MNVFLFLNNVLKCFKCFKSQNNNSLFNFKYVKDPLKIFSFTSNDIGDFSHPRDSEIIDENHDEKPDGDADVIGFSCQNNYLLK